MLLVKQFVAQPGNVHELRRVWSEGSRRTDLFGFYCMCEFGRERNMSDRDIVHDEVESKSSLRQVFPNKLGHLR